MYGDLPIGIYFDLDEDAYHNDVALGSSDLKRLAVSPFDFWWESRFNPAREPDEATPALIRGKAVHKAVLEGVDAFRASYGRKTLSWATKDGKDERARFEAAGLTGIPADDYDRILVAATILRANPSLAEAFSGGRSEVSVIWRGADGVKRKARFDYLKIRAIADLKSIANESDIDFREACRLRFYRMRYDVQAVHYGDGRQAMAGLHHSGLVFGDHDTEWLRKVIAAGPGFAWVNVWWQSTGAPLTWASQLSPGNPILDHGRKMLQRAAENWSSCVARFGVDSPWVLAEPIEELDLTEAPAWALR